MSNIEFSKQTTLIGKGLNEAKPVFTGGSRLRFIGLPTNENGGVALDSQFFTFKGSITGTDWFTINDLTGKPLVVITRISQGVITAPGALKAGPAMLPLGDSIGSLFEGIQVIIPMVNLPETQDRNIEIYFERSNP